MKKIIVIPLLAFLVSCQNKTKARFVITNELEEVLDSVRLKSTAHEHATYYISIQPKETKVYLMDMTDLPKVDGQYLLTYKIGKIGKRKIERFGYFTNGFPYEDTIKIFIKSDTVTFDFILPEKY